MLVAQKGPPRLSSSLEGNIKEKNTPTPFDELYDVKVSGVYVCVDTAKGNLQSWVACRVNCCSVGELYMTEHEELSLSPLTFLTVSATRAASVNASLTPRFFIAEHSAIYVSDPISPKCERRAARNYAMTYPSTVTPSPSLRQRDLACNRLWASSARGHLPCHPFLALSNRT